MPTAPTQKKKPKNLDFWKQTWYNIKKQIRKACLLLQAGSFRQTRLLTFSGCSAVGSARGLGACDRLMSRPPKARKISVFLAFSCFSAAVCFGKKLLTTDLTTYGFDPKNSISGCRVTVTHQFWELAQAGSTPVIPTKNQPKMRFFAPLSADFLLIIGFCPPLRQIHLTAEKRLVL